MIQGGDITTRDGTGGRSTFGGPFGGESRFSCRGGCFLTVYRRGLAHRARQAGIAFHGESRPCDQLFSGTFFCFVATSSNDLPQYFITTAAAPWCDGKNVVFGEVVEGFDIVVRIQGYASAEDILRRPSATILVERSGLL